ncbi:MAG: hypothetical protein IMW90_22005 [Thermogemmatispora sp.]|jgi:hypothetical protein|uniref:hypothetical protein n=1 Tax=Thermogemmatispora sp. TaxID=1968838 RepID=UPI001A027633|nr:hypothetical protein [Thermogemmatispora sp.]MBE3568400.1 hypothetical protein [Thermogemmatispora sp.]
MYLQLLAALLLIPAFLVVLGMGVLVLFEHLRRSRHNVGLLDLVIRDQRCRRRRRR